jgi:hypothetical protein
VFAMFGDPRLPDRYRGQPTGRSLRSDSMMVDVADRFDALAADQQAAIGQYFVPPAYATGAATAAAPSSNDDSKLAASPQTDRPGGCSVLGVLTDGWINLSSDHFRVWINHDKFPVMSALIGELSDDAEHAYQSLVGGSDFRAPLDDVTSSPRLACNGGDGKIDIYVEDDEDALPGAWGLTVPTSAGWTGGTPTSAYILLTPALLTADVFNGRLTVLAPWNLRSTVAHELMHVIQFAYKNLGTPTFNWVREATATWAEDVDRPSDDTEHSRVRSLMSALDKPLFFPNHTCLFGDTSPECLADPKADLKMYGAYLFFQYLSWAVPGEPVRTFFENASTASDSLLDLDVTLNSLGAMGLGKVWQDFALAAWNGGEVPETKVFRRDNVTNNPVSDYHLVLLGDPVGAAIALTAPTAIAPGVPLGKDVDLPELSVVYDRYVIPAAARSLVFYNGFSQNMSTIPVTPGSVVGPSQQRVRQDLGTQAIAYVTTAEQKKGRHLWALEKLEDPTTDTGVSWKLDDWTDQGFVPLCLDKQSERVQELVLVFSNAAYTQARATDFSANAIGPLGDQKATLVVSPVPCWKYQGTTATSVAFKDSSETLTLTTSLTATYEAKAYLETATGPLGTGQVLRSWQFVANPASVMGNRTLSRGCGGAQQSAIDAQDFGAELFSTTMAPRFDSVLPFPSDGPGYAAVWSGPQDNPGYDRIQLSFQTCDNPPYTFLTPAVGLLDFDLDFTSWQKVDLVQGRLVTPAAGLPGPVDGYGNYGDASPVTHNWCLAALREGELAPTVCP